MYYVIMVNRVLLIFTLFVAAGLYPKTLDSVFVDKDTLLYLGYEAIRAYDSQNEVWFVTIKKGGEVLKTFTSGGQLKEWTNFGPFPFLGPERSQLIVEQFSGGAHCCWSYWIFDAWGDLELLYASEEYPVGYGLTPVDIDTDGVFEFTQTVLSFDYFDRLPHALSPLPAAVFKYDDNRNKYVPANELFPDWLLEGIDEDTRRVKGFNDTLDFKTYDDPHGEYLSAVLEVVLRYVYAGKDVEAWGFYEKAYRLSDKEEMESRIRKKLGECSIYRHIYGS